MTKGVAGGVDEEERRISPYAFLVFLYSRLATNSHKLDTKNSKSQVFILIFSCKSTTARCLALGPPHHRLSQSKAF